MTSRAWFLHDSGAFGVEYVAVKVIGNGRKMVTIEREGRRVRTSVGNLRLIPDNEAAPEWAEDYR